jgi:hypothetical protein
VARSHRSPPGTRRTDLPIAGRSRFIARAGVAVIANVARVAGRRLTAAPRPEGVCRTRSLPRLASGPAATVACLIAYLRLPNPSAREDGL